MAQDIFPFLVVGRLSMREDKGDVMDHLSMGEVKARRGWDAIGMTGKSEVSRMCASCLI
jgi:hypothetical protein